MVTIYDFIKAEHDGYFYDPVQGRLFKIEEVNPAFVGSDGVVSSRRKQFKGRQELCTHIINFVMTGKWVEVNNCMDHKDGDPANNRWDNLREATRGQNNQNRKSRGRWKHTDLELEMGVEVTPAGRFRVKVQGIHLGTFDIVEEANERARFSRRHLYGEFDIYSSRGKENANFD